MPAVIAEIEAIPLRIPLKPDLPGAALWGEPLSAADSLLVKVTTDDGTVGWGEAFGLYGTALAVCALDELITPLCLGHDAADIATLMAHVQRKLHVFGRGGAITYALSAVDIALWDIAGKSAAAPVCRLLGGAPAALRCYASLACYTEPDRVRAAVRRAVDAGFGAIKLHESTLPAMHAARDEAGPEVALIVDAGCAWTLGQAQAVAAELHDLGLLFLEEPLWPPENFDGLAELRRSTGLPVASGENVGTILEFERLLTAGAVDFVQPSPAKVGGITELRKVFPLAAVRNVRMMTHSFYDGPGLLAAIQVAAALGGADAMVEWRWFDLEASIYGDALAPANGRIVVPDGPGLGIDPDPEVISAYRCDGGRSRRP
ncbi:mandelate racemase/muconate lactonizing enzyme family protein [Mycolicibacter sinensis]|jgi:L-alanine-DL-glutamate epimerase-like enolase superfamily enzyme|uniref:L-alanine-DL-glutamate epimerase n=1 Tax=Mycolicibacter sinensis (strain JDM601) TaxID=875328 RepID=A0A1A2EST7_MYCSD|nr:mandelate racemase/muconate lactonizing enzyme family protein [Mycolicibacter sinensis]OBG07574.1 L-alanine-DL-glutamate epimerase [Mycolicibacter sinensis]OBG08692.1 L-alanine-DL-glutamate epimerase [Mycolicibacter sinensis]